MKLYQPAKSGPVVGPSEDPIASVGSSVWTSQRWGAGDCELGLLEPQVGQKSTNNLHMKTFVVASRSMVGPI